MQIVDIGYIKEGTRGENTKRSKSKTDKGDVLVF